MPRRDRKDIWVEAYTDARERGASVEEARKAADDKLADYESSMVDEAYDRYHEQADGSLEPR
jgi:hypothetical protein